MPTWFLTVEVASDLDAHAVDLERLARLPSRLEQYEATASGGGFRYGAVLKAEEDNPKNVLTRGLADFNDARRKLDLPDWPVVRCELLTADEFQRRVAQGRIPRLVGEDEAARLLEESVEQPQGVLGTSEATAMLQVSRQRFAKLSARNDFPRPVAKLAATPIWLASSIEAYARQRRTLPGRPPASWKREPLTTESTSFVES